MPGTPRMGLTHREVTGRHLASLPGNVLPEPLGGLL